MTSYRIRAAVAGDLESVIMLDRMVEKLPHWGSAEYLAALSTIRAARSSRDTAGFVSGPKRCLFVAERGSDIAGFAVGVVTEFESEVLAELESVGVAASARRAGIGRALCEAVIEWSRRLDAAEIGLEVRSRSAGPITLYAGLGFVPIGLRKSYYKEPADDAILMRLTLAAGRSPTAGL